MSIELVKKLLESAKLIIHIFKIWKAIEEQCVMF